MTIDAPIRGPRPVRTRLLRRFSSALLLAGLLPVLAPATSPAAITTFGSPLSVPATLDTAANLSYQGTNTSVPRSAEAPNGVYHTYHYGADGALWSSAQASGAPSAPATGQAVQVSLEGCAQPAGGVRPLTQIHFQDLSPLPGGGAKVNITSQPFDIPVCGSSGASGSTVTTYEPVNLCVSQGDYVNLNEEGGYVEHVYQSGVPYRVLGAVPGSTTDSFIKGGGTGNGAILSPSYVSTMDGFASNQNAELMLQVRLGTGPDATHMCAGGTKGAPAVLGPVTVFHQTVGVNNRGVIAVGIYCRPPAGCNGVATLSAIGRQASKASYGHTSFSLPGNRTSHVPIRLSSRMIRLLRTHRGGVRAVLSALVAGKTASQTITLSCSCHAR
jgi:hypothetical protein